jgi:hypothetical protein
VRQPARPLVERHDVAVEQEVGGVPDRRGGPAQILADEGGDRRGKAPTAWRADGSGSNRADHEVKVMIGALG